MRPEQRRATGFDSRQSRRFQKAVNDLGLGSGASGGIVHLDRPDSRISASRRGLFVFWEPTIILLRRCGSCNLYPGVVANVLVLSFITLVHLARSGTNTCPSARFSPTCRSNNFESTAGGIRGSPPLEISFSHQTIKNYPRHKHRSRLAGYDTCNNLAE